MLFIASDHGGYQLKQCLTRYLETQLRVEFKDLGPSEYAQTDDFPDYAIPLAREVAKDKENLGILICATGHGMCIAANKVKGARAVVGYNIQGTEMARKHNDANVLCLAGKILTEDHAAAIVKTFLNNKFEGEERLVRRNKKIEELEK